MQNQALLSVFAFAALSFSASAADFTVSNTSSIQFNYTINGKTSPTLTLTRGVTYTFAVSSVSVHPFEIATFAGARYNNGVVNNNISSGTITFTVPQDAPNTLKYICSVHGFGGTINIINPAPPALPEVSIVSISVTTSNVTLTSIGTNGWITVPEFTSNLVNAVWTPVSIFNNTYANGTNTTSFDRLDPICGSNVFLRISNTSP
jgi:hypothetical protein